MTLRRQSEGKWAAIALFAVAAVIGSLGVQAIRAQGVLAATSGPASPEHDAQLRAFLQKRFRMASVNQISLGTPSRGPIAGLWTRTATFTSERGQTINVTLFTDASGSKVIIGQFLDTSQDPWGRVDLKQAHLDDRPTTGPADAPVTVIEFGDFECPFCARALNILETMVNTTYKGKMRLMFKNYPLNGHLWAMDAALAAECVREQNPEAFWDFARNLYRDQGEISPTNVRDHINRYATSLKLDTKALSACMIGRAATERIQQDVADGAALHVSSTPTFFVNSIPVVGFPDPSALSFVIDSELRSRQAAAKR